ncbi:MAG: hypothetical protein JKY65_18340 [Planctomycetes bacterium]|nr:hypothetical protein [Planctomycetota bacterium]
MNDFGDRFSVRLFRQDLEAVDRLASSVGGSRSLMVRSLVRSALLASGEVTVECAAESAEFREILQREPVARDMLQAAADEIGPSPTPSQPGGRTPRSTS